ncbi:LamG-like jellyroll fold domain-containing protein [Saccharicrinis sp. FJH62]|uniref:LamG-like jellyroll fold domain-containing protein n=1 Tax=Saccharicrinis sp. FJH62 TaxID=3344657 RepID=UPI0035D3DCFC
MRYKPLNYLFISRLSVITLLLLIQHLAKAQDLNEGLILSYTFENISGSTITDDSGNGNDGTMQGGATVFTGKTGKGVICNKNGDYIEAPDNINAGMTSFTFASWVRLLSRQDATRFFDWGTGTDGTNNFIAFIPSYGSDDGYMNLRFRPASGTALNIMSTEKCPTLSWAHVAVTYNWDGSKGSVKMYLNGNTVAQTSNLSYNIASWLGTTTDNYFGYSRWTQDLNGFRGIFDDIRVYNRALSDEEILMLTGLDELYAQYDQLDLGDLSGVTGNLTLPTTLGDKGVTVTWTSSQPTVIAVDGTVIRPDYFNSNVVLTATVKLGSISKTKTFNATVLANSGTEFKSDLLVRYDFSNLDGSTVTDIAEKGFSGTLKNTAKVVTMGTESTGIFNVLSLGNSTGYFDMGSDMGQVVSRLNEYTISAYFRIDDSYSGLDNNGNFLWNLSNTADAMSYANGYIICSLKDQSLSISPGNYTEASGNQDVGYSKNALKGNWHNLTFTQQGTAGTIYIDGIAVAKDKITNLPTTTLIKSGITGTLYNWLGRSCYTSDVYLRNTLIYDFRIYSRALDQDEIAKTKINVSDNLTMLEKAYAANIDDSKTAETTITDMIRLPKAGYLEIVKNDNSVVSLKLDAISHFTANDNSTIFDFTSGSNNTFANSDIRKITFAQWATALNEPELSSNLVVYPIPATDRLHVIATNSESDILTIFSLTGRQVLSRDTKEAQAGIDISRLPEGVYILKCGRNVAKFTKQ